MLEVGRAHVNVLYSFRSVSRAIPMVGGNNDPNKKALHMNTFKVRASFRSYEQLSQLVVQPARKESSHMRRDEV